MKKLIYIIIVMLAVAATTSVAQSLRKTEKINYDQVPVSILSSFKNDFGKIPEGGYWAATFTIDRAGSRAMAKPLFYSFHKRTKTEKIEVRYTVDGALDFFKGLEKVISNT